MFADRFQLILMGFLTTSLHKNCNNDVKLLETWWFWPILDKKKLIFIQIRNNLIFMKKSPWTPMSQLSPVCIIRTPKPYPLPPYPIMYGVQQNQPTGNHHCIYHKYPPSSGLLWYKTQWNCIKIIMHDQPCRGITLKCWMWSTGSYLVTPGPSKLEKVVDPGSGPQGPLP
jgi:hypothetical protein